VTDGKVFDLPGPVEVIGTESYKTVTGASNTVFVIRGMPSHEWEQVREYLKKNLPGKPLKLRKWTDLAGKVLVEAEYVSHDKTEVTVRLADKTEQKLPISKLNKTDRIFIKDK
jgi:hypothetical protein